MPSTRRSPLAAILWGGFIAGTVDIGAASLISGYSPVVILKYVAGGLLGRGSLAGGMGNAVLGLLLQWIMSIVIAAIFVVFLRNRVARPNLWTAWGIAYGAVVFAVMNYVVVPLSALHSVPHFSVFSFVANLAAMLLFGWIVGFFAKLMLRTETA
ncbi:YqhR family membrane protein [Dyella jiangningensis]|uniref:DUF1440 domain-containing protein n=1 Tax=Dyella jiangningensis TaxID=1379159 RepID=A0A328P5K8_9GAMM|nr:YqhR family membrane protein [Dyella jiangningensis]RAO77547.1 hypothetical protein CA260_06650 [Dyella jiangningensis]